MQKFPGQGSHLHHSSDQGHSSDNADLNPLCHRRSPELFPFFTDVKPNYLKGLSHVLNRLPKPVLLPELPTVSPVVSLEAGTKPWPPPRPRWG